jgi:hypothetical protein
VTTRSWIRNLFARPVTRLIRKAPHRAGLVLDVLEDRFVPSVTAPAIARNLADVAVNEGSPATNGGAFNDAEGRAAVTLTASLGTLHAPDRRKLSWPDATANCERKGPARSPRLARHTIGFWLGGALLGGGAASWVSACPITTPSRWQSAHSGGAFTSVASGGVLAL